MLTPTDAGFWKEAQIVDADWWEELKPGYWAGTLSVEYEGKRYEVGVQGDPEGNGFSEHEHIEWWGLETDA